MAAIKEVPKPTTENGHGPVQAKDVAPSKRGAPMRPIDSPFAFIRWFAKKMDQLFENYGFGFGLRMPSLLTRGHELLHREAGLVSAEWSPRVDILLREDQFVVRAELLGLTKDDIKAEVTDHLITLHGERKQEKKEEREGYYSNECSQGSFYRAIRVPEGVDASKATAEFRNGVLEIVMPALARAENHARRLEIRESRILSAVAQYAMAAENQARRLEIREGK